MFKKQVVLTAVGSLLAALLIFGGCAKKEKVKPTAKPGKLEKEVVKIAILPCTEPLEEFKKFEPLAEYLTKETGFKIELLIPNSYDDFNKLVTEGGADFAFQDSYSYVINSGYLNPQSFLKALTPEGESSHRGVVVARKDSGLKKVEDLKGKVMLFGPESSAAKYLAVRLLLEEKKVSIRDLRSYSFGGSCEDVALNIYLKQADAGAMCDYSYDEMSEERKSEESEIDMVEMTIIGQTQLVPNWIFAALRDTNQTVIDKMDKALLELDGEDPEHKELLESAELGGFAKATDDEYNTVRDLAKKVEEIK